MNQRWVSASCLLEDQYRHDSEYNFILVTMAMASIRFDTMINNLNVFTCTNITLLEDSVYKSFTS
jgi:uncharacterized protein YcgI (DUF1989 family)